MWLKKDTSKIVISTGMSNLKEVKEAIDILKKRGVPEKSIALLHYTTEYPAPLDSINLNAMITLKKNLNVRLVTLIILKEKMFQSQL